MNAISDFVLYYLLHPLVRYALAWLVAGIALGFCVYDAWTCFGSKHRADGNAGHTAIDFGGQWTMGRMLVTGNGKELYNRYVQRAVLRAAYPHSDEPADEFREPHERGTHDADNLVGSFMGSDDPQALLGALAPLAAGDEFQLLTLLASGKDQWKPERLQAGARPIGGPLYPPINGLYFYPLGLLRPLTAYRCMQALNLLMAFLAALGISLLTKRRFWLPVAFTFILVFPGFSGSINLGQNATITLGLLVWGWVLLAWQRPLLGGAVWGLLAFKPVWALAFLLLLLYTGRWRAAATMIGVGCLLILATLPFVGIHSWFDWLHVGKEAAILYNTDKNWIHLSRDVFSIPRRWLINFDPPAGEPTRDPLIAHVYGWGALLSILAVNAVIGFFLARRSPSYTGPAAAFLLLGAWLTCYHFMYYDVLLAAFPVALLFADPRKYLEPLLVIAPLRKEQAGDQYFYYFRPELARFYPPALLWMPVRLPNVWVLNRMFPNLVLLLAATKFLLPTIGVPVPYGHPWDTFVLIFMWLWCGGLTVYQALFGGGDEATEEAPATPASAETQKLKPAPPLGASI